MRVLHVIPAVAERYGGPSTALHGMARALAAVGVEVTVATTNADGRGTLDVPLHRPVIEGDVTYRYFPRTMPGEWKFSRSLARWIRERVSAFDVVTVHALFSFATIPGCREARRQHVPYIVRPLGTLGEWSLQQHRWKKAPYLALIERPHLEHAAAIHVTSDDERAGVAALGYDAKVRVIALGVDMPAREPRLRQRADALRLLFLSRLHPGKNLPTLFAAMRRALAKGARITLTVAGAGDAEYTAYLRNATAAHGIDDAVEFVGHLSGDPKAVALANADVFVLPSAHENFGISVVEALAAGLPVLISPHVGIARDVQEANAGVVAEVSETALADSLVMLAQNRKALASMGEAARELARNRYSWSTCARSLVEMYTDVIQRARGRDHDSRSGARAHLADVREPLLSGWRSSRDVG